CYGSRKRQASAASPRNRNQDSEGTKRLIKLLIIAHCQQSVDDAKPRSRAPAIACRLVVQRRCAATSDLTIATPPKWPATKRKEQSKLTYRVRLIQAVLPPKAQLSMIEYEAISRT